MSKLYFRYGAMNSGKSTHLLQTAYNYEELGRKVLIIKPSVDTKAGDSISSRLGATRKVDVLIPEKASVISSIDSFCSSLVSVSCVLVDEVQFLSAKQVDELLVIANRGIPVICYGLRTDFLTEGFEGSTRLLQIAHSIEEQKTMCKCGKKAIFNVREFDGKVVTEGSQIEIDNGEVNYVSMCSKCREFSLNTSK